MLRRIVLLWIVLATSALVAALVIHQFVPSTSPLQFERLVILLGVTAAQAAVLSFFRSTPNESPDQHR